MSTPFISPADSGEVERDFRVHHVVVKPGEDLVSTVKAYALRNKEPRFFYIISADGFVSNATLIQPLFAGEITIYKGEYEIISISGTLSNSDHSNSFPVTVALKDPNGHVVEGWEVNLSGVSEILVVLGSIVEPDSNILKTRTPNIVDSIHYILVDKGKDIIAKLKEFVRRWGRSVRINMISPHTFVSRATLFKRINVAYEGKFQIKSMEGTLSPSQSNVDGLLLINSSPIKVTMLGEDNVLLEGVAVQLIAMERTLLSCSIFTEPPPLHPPLLPPSLLELLSPPSPNINQQFYGDISQSPPTPPSGG